MSAKNPEYDFKWCPGCGDFGVRRALEAAIEKRRIETEQPAENNVVVAGIGCSGNMVHLLEDSQPYGFHGIHGRTLPVSLGIKMARPDLNVVVVAGDGDFLSIGMEHIAPQAARNLNIAAVIMDNAVYGLTKGQASPTSAAGQVTSSTPYGKTEVGLNALKLYLTVGIPFVTSGLSSKVKELSQMIYDAMEFPGFAVVHVQSPCTTYHDTYEQLKGNARKGIEPQAWDVPEEHDPADLAAAYEITDRGGVPMGVIYRDGARETFDASVDKISAKAKSRSARELVDSYAI